MKLTIVYVIDIVFEGRVEVECRTFKQIDNDTVKINGATLKFISEGIKKIEIKEKDGD